VLAERLAAGATRDFNAAVQQGDPGSSEDVGTVKQGILEPAAEFVLFSLPVDGIGGPVDTPRGYWVVKRLE
jgi:parvulin-like peptidyl-prolyl isomerase